MKKRGEIIEEQVEEKIEEQKEKKKPSKQKPAKKAKKKPEKKSKDKKTKKEDKKKKKSKKNQHLSYSFKTISPYVDYDEEKEVIVNRDGSAFDYMHVRTKDLMNAATTELERDKIALTQALRLVKDSVKIISLNFPCNTKKQMEYFDAKIRKDEEKVFTPWLEIKKEELKFLQENTSHREFFIMVTGKTVEDCVKNRELLNSALIDLADPCSKEAKMKLLEKFNNPNTFVAI